MKKNQIYRITGKNYTEMTVFLLQEARLGERIGDKNKKIGIKPNLVSATPPEMGATTHPEVVEGILRYLQSEGFNNLVMLEGSWVGGRTAEAAELCGYYELSEKYGVPFIDTQKDKWETVDCEGIELNICNSVRDIDFMINVPVLKGHCQTKITCALKNMKGLIPNTEKRRFHTMGLHRPIAHLSVKIPQDFIVVDHICGDLDFEDGGNPVDRYCVMAGCDPVLIDSYVCRLLGYKIKDVPYVELAAKLGSGSTDIESAEFVSYNAVNSSPEYLKVDEVIAQEHDDGKRKIVELSDMVDEIESCSACYASLIPALDRLKDEGLLDNLTEKVCIGQGYRGKSGKLGVGQCTSGFEYHLKGCPPTEEEIYSFLREYIAAKLK